MCLFLHTYRICVQLLLSFYTVSARFYDNFRHFVRTQTSLFLTAARGAVCVRHCKCLYYKGLQKAVFRRLICGLSGHKT